MAGVVRFEWFIYSNDHPDCHGQSTPFVHRSPRSGDLFGEDLAASTLGLRLGPGQDPERATFLLSTPHLGESGKNHRPFFRKGFADTRYCPLQTEFLTRKMGVSGWRRRCTVSQTTLSGTFCTRLPNLLFSLSILSCCFFWRSACPPFKHPGAHVTSQTGPNLLAVCLQIAEAKKKGVTACAVTP